MKKILYLIIIFNFAAATVNAQQAPFDEKKFFQNLSTSYYSLSDAGVHNFIAMVTSLKMQKFAEEMWKGQEIFPLQLIWFNPDALYLSQRGVPRIEKGKYKEYQDLLAGLKIQIKGILVDLQRFSFGGLYKSIPGDYTLKHSKDAVQLTITSTKGNILTKIKYLFGYNGLCLLNEIAYPQQNKVIVIYPKFKIVKSKWLCQGWTVQTYLNEKVESGIELKLTNSFVNDKWVPSLIQLQVQKSAAEGKTFYDEIIIKNYLFDQSIQLQGQKTK